MTIIHLPNRSKVMASPWNSKNHIITVQHRLVTGDGSGGYVQLCVLMNDYEIFNPNFYYELLGFSCYFEGGLCVQGVVDMPIGGTWSQWTTTPAVPPSFMFTLEQAVIGANQYFYPTSIWSTKPILIGKMTKPDVDSYCRMQIRTYNQSGKDYYTNFRFLGHETMETIKPHTHYYWP